MPEEEKENEKEKKKKKPSDAIREFMEAWAQYITPTVQALSEVQRGLILSSNSLDDLFGKPGLGLRIPTRITTIEREIDPALKKYLDQCIFEKMQLEAQLKDCQELVKALNDKRAAEHSHIG